MLSYPGRETRENNWGYRCVVVAAAATGATAAAAAAAVVVVDLPLRPQVVYVAPARVTVLFVVVCDPKRWRRRERRG